MKKAFKEWAVVVDALGRGDQILILRKGGISEGKGGFTMEDSAFFLFPTLFHQQAESVLPGAQARYQEIAPLFPPSHLLRLEFWAEVIEARKVENRESLASFSGHHIWKDEVIADRFDWGREQSIYALAVRTYRLPSAVVVPMLPSYGGCKSWIDLETDVATSGSSPVLEEREFQSKLKALPEQRTKNKE